ncbi:MAG: glycosyltransferase [Fibrobacterota bacterium]
MIAPTPFFSDRGCHVHIYEEIHALQLLGHTLRLCTYGLGRDVPGIPTVRTFRLPFHRKTAAGPSPAKLLLLPLLTFTVLRQLFTFRPHIIHAHLHEGALIGLLCRLLRPSVPVVFDWQGSLPEELVQHHLLRRNSPAWRAFLGLERRLLRNVPVIAGSREMANAVVRLGGRPDRVLYAQEGVNLELFSPRPLDRALAGSLGLNPVHRCLVYSGLLEEYQGVHLMLEAFARIASVLPDLRFLVIGFPNIERYREQANRLGIGDRTMFPGRVDYWELPRYLSLAAIAIAPKIANTENDGKLLNYMSMGLPVATWDRPLSREILGTAGIFARYQDPSDLAGRLQQTMENPAECGRLGAAARERAEKLFSWHRTALTITGFYQTLRPS